MAPLDDFPGPVAAKGTTPGQQVRRLENGRFASTVISMKEVQPWVQFQNHIVQIPEMGDFYTIETHVR